MRKTMGITSRYCIDEMPTGIINGAFETMSEKQTPKALT